MEPNNEPMKPLKTETVITLTATEVITLQNILMEVPAKYAIPLLKKINDAKGM